MTYNDNELEDFYKGSINEEINKMYNILKFLDGKKTIIVGIITTTVALLVLKGVIDNDIGVYIDTVTTLILGSAAIRTSQLRNDLQ